MYKYEIWLLGEDENCLANDYEKMICLFDDEDLARYLFYSIRYDLEKKYKKSNYSPHIKMILEKVKDDTCVELLNITYLK